MSIERRPVRSLLALAIALASCSKALPENPSKNEHPITSESSPIVDLSRSETIIFSTPTEKPTLTSTPTEIPTFTPTATIIPTPTETPTPIPLTPTKEAIIPELSLSLWEVGIYQAITELRSQENLPPLELSDPLVEIARERSLDMATRNYFGHTTPEGLMIFDLLDQTGIYYPYAGENLARTNISQIEEAVQTIMKQSNNSPTHRKNLLNPAYNLIGIGYAFSEEDNLRYIAVVFASLPK